MRLTSPWTPRLADGTGSVCERLVATIGEDIAGGVIPFGARLPPHRELAYRLGIGVGTVTKAYGILEQRGLIQGVRGRGMFAAGPQAQAASSIDLSINRSPQMLSEQLLSATLVTLSKMAKVDVFDSYGPIIGRYSHRLQMAGWLKHHGLNVPPDQIILCHGAQHALAIAFGLACRKGGAIFTEATTYPGAISLARNNGYELVPVGIDSEGIRPDSLREAMQSSTSRNGRFAVYVTPTLQNPTGASMGLERRQEIVRICRAHDVLIIEDDVYSIFAKDDVLPIASIAPERTIYVNGLSKALTPGLRIGILVSPPSLMERAVSCLLATGTTASPLSCLIMEQWLSDGTASSVQAAIKADSIKRMGLARELLGSWISSTSNSGFHVWLPMREVDAERLARRLAGKGVIVTAPGATAVDADATEGGVRLCIGMPPMDTLRTGLAIVRSLLVHDLDLHTHS